jgi:hypothetical protein
VTAQAAPAPGGSARSAAHTRDDGEIGAAFVRASILDLSHGEEYLFRRTGRALHFYPDFLTTDLNAQIVRSRRARSSELR